jgi:branched-chain amino acid transport system permease protein
MNKKYIKPSIYSAIIVFLFLIPLFITGTYQLHVLVLVGIGVMLASSLRLIFLTGLLSLGHGGMMAIGAYTSALLVMKLGFSSWAALGIGAAAAAVMAFMIGFPFMRLRGMYFSLVTVFFSQIIASILSEWREVTGGTFGLTHIPTPDPIVIPGLLNIDFSSKAHFYYLILLLVLLSLLILYAIEHSRTGMTWLSIRQSDSLSEAVGINVIRYKVLAFAIGSFFAGLAGSFFSQFITVVTPTAFGFVYSVYVVVYIIVGGTSAFIGPVLGAIILVLLPEVSRVFKEYEPFLFTGVLIIIIFFLRDGLVSLPLRLKNIFKKEKKAAPIAAENN